MKCSICKFETKNLHGLSCHISKHHRDITIQNYYDNYIGSIGICNICGKPTKFLNLVKGYSKFCSTACLNKSPEHIQAVRDGNLKKYGVENYSQSDEFKTTRKQSKRQKQLR